MRRERQRKVKRVRRVRTQRDVVRDVMLSANERGAWLTLAELGAMTRYPETSISAQLRHLKKPQFGNFEMEKRPRAGLGAELAGGHGVEWEYRLTRRRRVVQRRVRVTAAPVSALAPDITSAATVC
jgi:hypothetical protein